MAPLFVNILQYLVDKKEIIGTVATTITITAALFKGWPKLVIRARERQRKYKLQRRINAIDYTEEDILRATTYYIEPECQVVDPAGTEDFRRIYPVRQNLFEVVDDLLQKQATHKFSLILADTGMGKTSFLLNYYARHWSRRARQKFSIALIPLGSKKALESIDEVPNKAQTVLFLDAFDEDTRAARNHRARFHEIITASSRFRHVVITCRTQFFSREDEIPNEAGIIRVGPIAPGDSREYIVNKLYLSPFSDEQIRRYIRRRFPFYVGKRQAALEIIKKIEDLPARPMLLAQIELILSLGQECKHSFQIYEQMIHSWLNREKGIADPVSLREFCEHLAVDIFVNRDKRGAEKISPDQLGALCTNLKISLPQIEHIRSRSLLNRDAQGNLKFAHRSIMEYLFIASFRRSPSSVPRVEWTDQMKLFYWETSLQAWEHSKIPITFQKDADFSGLERLRLKPLIRLRDRAITMTEEDTKKFKAISQEKHSRIERSPHFYRTIDVSATDEKLLQIIPDYYKYLASSISISRLPDSPVLNEAVNSLSRFLSGNTCKVVVDHALGVAWEIPGDCSCTHFELVRPRADVLSHLKFADLQGWRIPTLEEAFSLMHLAHYAEYKPYFEGLEKRIWVSDRVGIQHLSVNLQTAEIRAEGFSQPMERWPRAVCVASAWSGGPKFPDDQRQ